MDPLERWSFASECFQQESALAKKLILNYYPLDKAVELFDLVTRKAILRRCRVNLNEKDFFIGSNIDVYGRLITILDYADIQTQQLLQIKKQSAFLLIKPDGLKYLGKIWCQIDENDLQIKRLRTMQLDRVFAEQYYREHYSDVNYSSFVSHLTCAPVVACEIIGSNSVKILHELMGEEDPTSASKKQPNSFRALFGKDAIENLVDCPSKEARIQESLKLFFGQPFAATARLFDSTLCLILPHAIKENKTGKIICDINRQGFRIITLKMVQIDRHNSEEFYEVYKGVVPEYVAMAAQLASGPCLAIEIGSSEHEKCYPLHTTFRAFCGPSDPEIARQIRPQSLRAKYGNNKVQNAVHCTDLEEDILLESEYFFKIID